jgi:hypothetical protein
VRELVLLGLRAEAQLVDVVDDLAQVVAAGDLVLDLPEDLADLVLDRVRAARPLLELPQIRKERVVDEIAQVIAGKRVVELRGSGRLLAEDVFDVAEGLFKH